MEDSNLPEAGSSSSCLQMSLCLPWFKVPAISALSLPFPFVFEYLPLMTTLWAHETVTVSLVPDGVITGCHRAWLGPLFAGH